MLGRKIARHGLTIIATVLLGGFLATALVRLAPGFDVDEAQLDPRLNSESVRALREARLEQHNIFRFYWRSLQRAVHGDLGTSLSLGQPVSVLLRQRAPLTMRLVGIGLLLSWAVAMALALSAAWLRLSAYDTLTTVISGTFLCIPAAVLALLSVLLECAGSAGNWIDRVSASLSLCAEFVGEGVFPAAHCYGTRQGIERNANFVLACGPRRRAAVAGCGRSFGEHRGRRGYPGRSSVRAAGVGQLAWQAALARDLPLLMNLTILVTLVTLLANSSADVMGHMLRGQEA